MWVWICSFDSNHVLNKRKYFCNLWISVLHWCGRQLQICNLHWLVFSVGSILYQSHEMWFFINIHNNHPQVGFLKPIFVTNTCLYQFLTDKNVVHNDNWYCLYGLLIRMWYMPAIPTLHLYQNIWCITHTPNLETSYLCIWSTCVCLYSKSIHRLNLLVLKSTCKI